MGFNWLVQGWEVSDSFRINCCPIKAWYPVTLEILGSLGEAAVNTVLEERRLALCWKRLTALGSSAFEGGDWAKQGRR